MLNDRTYESLKKKIKIEKIDWTNMRISQISSSTEYAMDEQLQNLPIFRAKFWFFKWKKI